MPRRIFVRFTPTGVGTARLPRKRDGWVSVHPHRRGDGSARPRTSCAKCGSPPQAWGRQLNINRLTRRRRFTPTGVGTAGISFQYSSLIPVHPHRRGDGPALGLLVVVRPGSPPQAWGRRTVVTASRLVLRFTPTGVGTAITGLAISHPHPVHPHRRGDGRRATDAGRCPAGSPPQAWGRQSSVVVAKIKGRFTPTGVGTAPQQPQRRLSDPVHPHRRGDGCLHAPPRYWKLGSPPQAWGRHGPDSSDVRGARFTPTGVGTAFASSSSAIPRSVHPHRRGDGTVPSGGQAAIDGSPPQAWGRLRLDGGGRLRARLRFTPTGVGTAVARARLLKPIPVHPHRRGDGEPVVSSALWARRFTPTGVGTAVLTVRPLGVTSVHPHRRGDGETLFNPSGGDNGSPPQAWGRLLVDQGHGAPSWFTPTGVGTAATRAPRSSPTSVHPHRRGDGKWSK